MRTSRPAPDDPRAVRRRVGLLAIGIGLVGLVVALTELIAGDAAEAAKTAVPAAVIVGLGYLRYARSG